MKNSVIMCIFLVFAIMVLCPAASAEGNNPGPELIPEYAYVETIVAHLDISGGIAECLGAGRSQFTWTQTSLTVQLQRSTDGSSWTTLNTWSSTGSGKTTVNAGGSMSVTTGYIYRTKVTCKIKNSNGSTLETGYAYKKRSYP